MKTVYIMRGIPGSGKSSIAWDLPALVICGSSAIHSTDDLCMVDGVYQFDAELAPQRHAQNLENFKASLEKGVEVVVVDNTNVKVQQYEPYVTEARAAGYRVAFVELLHPTLDEAVERNTHGVPLETINQMILDWEPSQHCAIIEDVNKAALVVEHLSKTYRLLIGVALSVGFVVGAATIIFIWGLSLSGRI